AHMPFEAFRLASEIRMLNCLNCCSRIFPFTRSLAFYRGEAQMYQFVCGRILRSIYVNDYPASLMREVAGEKLLEALPIARLDGPLLLQGFSGLRREFGQALRVWPMQIEEIILVQLRHTQPQLEKRATRVDEL